MVGLFYIHLPMSFSIPHQIEQDIIAGRAVYRTFQTGNGGQSILQVPTNSYAVIYGYDFSPAGGGFKRNTKFDAPVGNSATQNNVTIRAFETQQISFWTGSDFYPFIHHVDVKTVLAPYKIDGTNPAEEIVQQYELIEEINNSPISRQVYITGTNDITITHGLILANSFFQAAIPVTNRTPGFLTYGGSGQPMNTQTNYGPGVTPQSFMQPSTKDFADFAFGLLPPNPDDQAFATPDATNGLVDSTFFLVTQLGDGFNLPATNYYLCLHYALYSAAIPEQRG